MAEEVDWFALGGEIADILEHINDLYDMTCKAKWFRACLVISEKIVPLFKQLEREADAKGKLAETAAASPELVEGVEEIPEMELTPEQRARLMEEEL